MRTVGLRFLGLRSEANVLRDPGPREAASTVGNSGIGVQMDLTWVLTLTGGDYNRDNNHLYLVE